jgi:peptidoglycan/LPS O-acetylase OafA/YrhL
MPQLDSMRAVAVMGVLLMHLAPALVEPLGLGIIGVKPFFVLSGFLITGILLRGRRRVEEGRLTRGALLGGFLVNRTLRLWPLLLAALLCAAVLDVGSVRETFFWHAGYLSNFYMYRQGGWDGPASHLWSLSVEEQFYLVWPWLILFLPRRALVPTMLGAIAAAPVFRLLIALRTSWDDGVGILPLSCADTLAMGALLAVVTERDGIAAVARGRLRAAALWSGAALLVLVQAAPALGFPGPFRWAFGAVAVGLLSVWFVAGAAVGFGGRAGRLLESRPLVYLGTISYGIYVNHMFLRHALRRVTDALGLPSLDLLWGADHVRLNQATYAVILGLASVGLAALTWHFFERPISEWGRKLTTRWARAGAPDPARVPREAELARSRVAVG